MRANRNRWWKIYLSALLLIVAANNAIASDKTQNSRAVLKTISEQVQVSDHAEGRFEQRKFLHILPQPLLSSGNFYLNQESGLVWQITEPLSSRIVFNHSGIHQSNNGQQPAWEVGNDQPVVSMIGQLMKAAISFDWELLESYFFIEGRVDKSSDEQRWELTLTPKEDYLLKTINRIELKGEQRLKELVLFEASNDRTEITFNFVKTAPGSP